MIAQTATIASATAAAYAARNARYEAERADLEYSPWSDYAAQRAYVAMIAGCKLTTRNAVTARSVVAAADDTRAGRMHAHGVLTQMLEAFSQAYPDAQDGVIHTLSDTVQTLTW